VTSGAQAKQHRIEDIEDLIGFGGTFAEIVSRSGYKNWETLSKALRASDRRDLLEALRMKRIADGAPTGLPPVKRKPVCRVRVCGRKRYAKGHCKPHYMQKWKGVKQPNRTHCKLLGCGGKHKGLGYCNKHYLQHRKGKLEV
jgi:hypothetical protein